MSTTYAIEALRSNLIDVALVAPFANRESLSIKPIRELWDIVIAGNGCEELKDRKISLKELVKYPLICLNSTSTTRNYLDSVFGQHNLLLRPDIEVTSSNLIIPRKICAVTCTKYSLTAAVRSFIDLITNQKHPQSH